MEWLRCNNCYSKAAHEQEAFSLTKCGHVYCSRCITAAERQCPICNTVNVPTVRLQEPLDSTISSYFMPLKNQLEQILQVCNFQEGQIRITMERFNQLDEKYGFCKDVCRKLERAAANLRKQNRQDKDEYLKKIRVLEIENMQLKVALHSSQNSPYGNFRSNQSSASSSLNTHTCNKRFDQNPPKVTFSTPLSTNSQSISTTSSTFDKKYLQASPKSNGTFQIPSVRKVPRSAGNRSSVGTARSTPSDMIPERLLLDSLMISRS